MTYSYFGDQLARIRQRAQETNYEIPVSLNLTDDGWRLDTMHPDGLVSTQMVSEEDADSLRRKLFYRRWPQTNQETVNVDRARFERLREYVESERVLKQLLEDDPKGMNYVNVLAARDRFDAARDVLQPSDYAPLP